MIKVFSTVMVLGMSGSLAMAKTQSPVSFPQILINTSNKTLPASGDVKFSQKHGVLEFRLLQGSHLKSEPQRPIRYVTQRALLNKTTFEIKNGEAITNTEEVCNREDLVGVYDFRGLENVIFNPTYQICQTFIPDRGQLRIAFNTVVALGNMTDPFDKTKTLELKGYFPSMMVTENHQDLSSYSGSVFLTRDLKLNNGIFNLFDGLLTAISEPSPCLPDDPDCSVSDKKVKRLTFKVDPPNENPEKPIDGPTPVPIGPSVSFDLYLELVGE